MSFNGHGCGSCDDTALPTAQVIGKDANGDPVVTGTCLVTCATLGVSVSKTPLGGQLSGTIGDAKIDLTEVNLVGDVIGTLGATKLASGINISANDVTVAGNLTLSKKASDSLAGALTLSGQVTGALNNTVISKGLALDVLSLTDGKATLTGGNLTTTGDIVADDVTGDVGTFNNLKVTGDVDFSATAIESIGEGLVIQTTTAPATLPADESIALEYFGGGDKICGNPVGWVSIGGYKIAHYGVVV